jgi:putative Mg2+ transporter-C (MgtC) family protein
MNASLTEFDIVFRLVLAFAAGFVIGIERSSRRQVAGLRTHILISLGASCLMLLSIWLPEQLKGGDPGRIAAQVVAGMGFLGAGAIIKLGNNIRGLTTAASLWLTAAIGLTIGAGMFIAALTVIILALFTLILLHMIERKIFPEDNWKHVSHNQNSLKKDAPEQEN